MSDTSDPLALAATPRRMRVIARAAKMDAATTERALVLATETPAPREWKRFLSIALAILGAGLLLAGVISFVAYNWDRLGRFGKFALLEIAIAGAAVLAWRTLPKISGEVALFSAAVLVGPLLAIYGQTYQTGADPYGLFLTWALVILPWVAAARFSATWLLALALLELSLALYWVQVIAPADFERMFYLPLTLGALNLAALAAWEWQRGRERPVLTERWAQRILGMGTVYAFWIVAAAFVVSSVDRVAMTPGVIGVVALGAVVATALRYFKPRRDRFMVTIAVTAGMAWITVVVGRIVFEWMDSGYAFGLLVMSAFVIWQITMGVKWYRSMADAA